jgi:hypothetical protein
LNCRVVNANLAGKDSVLVSSVWKPDYAKKKLKITSCMCVIKITLMEMKCND